MDYVYIPFAYDYGESYREEVNGEWIAWTDKEFAQAWADKENKKPRNDGTRIIIRKWEVR